VDSLSGQGAADAAGWTYGRYWTNEAGLYPPPPASGAKTVQAGYLNMTTEQFSVSLPDPYTQPYVCVP
jgi:hypothetical protein